MDANPIIVTGVGRSGTSAVARICRSLDISMGHRFREPDETNPEGFCEDLDFLEILVAVSSGQIGHEKAALAMHAVATQRNATGKSWGFKDPLVLNMPDLIAEVFPDARYIVTERPFEQVLASLRRCYGMSEADSVAFVDRRIAGHKALPVGRTFIAQWDEIIGGTARKKIADYLGMNCPPRILYSIPNMGWIHTSCFKAMLGAAIRGGAAIDFDMPEEGEYVQKMNRFAKAVIRDGYDFWIHMDDDNGPLLNPMDLIALDKPVIGLPTPIWKQDKSWPFSYSAFDYAGDGQYSMHDPSGGGLQKVDAIGSGCMVVRADVLRAIGLPAFKRVKDADEVKTILGPDYYFSERVRAAGFQIYAHYGYKCSHIKDIELGVMFEKSFIAFKAHADAQTVRARGGTKECDPKLEEFVYQDEQPKPVVANAGAAGT